MTELLHLHPRRLRSHPLNMRRYYPPAQVAEMAASILATDGVLQALLVVPDPERTRSSAEDCYLVVDGNMRLAGALQLGPACPPLKCEVIAAAHAEQLLIMATTTALHYPKDPIAEALHYRRLLDEGYTINEISQHTGIAWTLIRGRLRWLELEPAIQEHVAAGRLPRDPRVADALQSIPDGAARLKLADKLAAHGAGIQAIQTACARLAESLHVQATARATRSPALAHAGYQRGLADERDISPEVARLLRELRAAGKAPRYVFLENVPPYMKSPAAEMIRQTLHGYRIAEAIFKHADYGICQKRERWHLIAALEGPAPLPMPTHSEQPGFTTQPWLRFAAIRESSPADPHYVSAKAWRGIVRRQTVNELKAIEREGNTNTSFAKCYIVDDDDLMSTVLASWWRGHSRNQATIVFDDYRFRAPTRLEVSRAQGFPDGFEFRGNVREQYEMIARAVPPPFAAAVARAILAAEHDNA